jgi:hypothetical protein
VVIGGTGSRTEPALSDDRENVRQSGAWNAAPKKGIIRGKKGGLSRGVVALSLAQRKRVPARRPTNSLAETGHQQRSSLLGDGL